MILSFIVQLSDYLVNLAGRERPWDQPEVKGEMWTQVDRRYFLSFFLQLLSTSLSTPWINCSTLNLKYLIPPMSVHSLWGSCFILLQDPFLNSKHLSSNVLCKENSQQWILKWKRKHRASECSQVLVSVPGCLLLTRMALAGAPEISLFWAVFRNQPNMIVLSDQRK